MPFEWLPDGMTQSHIESIWESSDSFVSELRGQRGGWLRE